MSSIMIFGLLAVILFSGAFLTKRRFGVLGLALAGGSILAELWAVAGGTFLKAEGFSFRSLPSENLAALAIILLPALLLLLRGPTYHAFLPRLGGALLFTILAFALVFQPLRPLLAGDEMGSAIYSLTLQYRELILSAGLAIALLDIFFTKASSHVRSAARH